MGVYEFSLLSLFFLLRILRLKSLCWDREAIKSSQKIVTDYPLSLIVELLLFNYLPPLNELSAQQIINLNIPVLVQLLKSCNVELG